MIKLPPYFQHPAIHISPLGIIPKKNKPGKWRLIVDLPIRTAILTFVCLNLDHLSALILRTGRGAFLTKADIKEAYGMLQAHPQDCHLLAVRWEDSIFIDQVLPFGLRSVPKIFSAVADAIHWMMFNNGLQGSLHYLDDFIIVSPSQTSAEFDKQALVLLWECLGVPMEMSKLEGQSQTIKFLGIDIDTVALQLILPDDKLQCLKSELARCIRRDTLFKKELESLI